VVKGVTSGWKMSVEIAITGGRVDDSNTLNLSIVGAYGPSQV